MDTLDANERKEITVALFASKAWTHIILPEIQGAIEVSEHICLSSGQSFEQVQQARSNKDAMLSLLRKIGYDP